MRNWILLLCSTSDGSVEMLGYCGPPGCEVCAGCIQYFLVVYKSACTIRVLKYVEIGNAAEA